MSKIVYLQCNDWTPNPEEAERLIYDYLEGSIYSENSVLKTTEEENNWIKENKLCINADFYDQSINYWITTTEDWIKNNFPELLPYANEVPEDELWRNDKKFFLKYIPENYGLTWINYENYEENKKYMIEINTPEN